MTEPRAAIIASSKQTGRPRIDISAAEVRLLAGRGLTTDQIADRLGVSRRTLYDRMKENVELRGAMDVGVSQAVDKAAEKLQELIEAGNLGAVIYYLRAKGGWSTKQEVTVTLRPDSGPLIDGHVTELGASHSRLLDGPDLDDDSFAHNI